MWMNAWRIGLRNWSTLLEKQGESFGDEDMRLQEGSQ
jgi:hypothetical protein